QGQPYPMREPQPSFSHREQQQHHYRQQQSGQPTGQDSGNVDRLPSFITGGGGQPQQQPHQAHSPNGHENQSDRFPLHRRRRRQRRLKCRHQPLPFASRR